MLIGYSLCPAEANSDLLLPSLTALSAPANENAPPADENTPRAAEADGRRVPPAEPPRHDRYARTQQFAGAGRFGLPQLRRLQHDADAGEQAKQDDDVVDAEFEEVKEDKK